MSWFDSFEKEQRQKRAEEKIKREQREWAVEMANELFDTASEPDLKGEN